MKFQIELRLLFVLGLVFLIGCEKKNSSVRNDLSEMHLKGRVKSIRKVGYEVKDSVLMTKGNRYEGRFEEFDSFNELGNLIESILFLPTGGLYSKNIFFYNEGNVLDEVHWFSEYGKESIASFKYDSKGNLTDRIIKDVDGTFRQKYTYKYDENGNNIESIWYYKNDSLISTILRSSYDLNGNKIDDRYYGSRGELYDKVTYKYDKNGLVIERDYYEHRTNKFYEKFSRVFDEDGDVVSMKTVKYNTDGKVINEEVERFLYDDHHNWIKRIAYLTNNIGLIEERQIEYYE